MTLFPVGNGDTTLLQFESNWMLIDFCHLKVAEDDDDKRIDLKSALTSLLDEAGRDAIDVVAITHCHNDHAAGFEEFFYLEHDDKYETDGRVHIGELWVPAAFIVTEGLTGAAALVQREARYRLQMGQGVRVFSAPEEFEDWVKHEPELTLDDIQTLITHAGDLVPGFDDPVGEVQVFVHAPFSQDFDPEGEDHNGSSLVLHLTVLPAGAAVGVMMGADAEWEVWQKVVEMSEGNNPERLDWDIFKVAHHCSYSALAEEAGEGTTKPVDEVAELFERHGDGCIIVATCNVIDSENTPPHSETAAYYRSIADNVDGFLVTMEYPKADAPEPIVINIGDDGPALSRASSKRWAGATAVVSSSSDRFGVG